MKAMYWILAGFGCIAASLLVGMAMMFYWMGQARSFATTDFDSPGRSDPFQGFGVVMIAVALANLLFIGGIIIVIVGFINLAKEPSRAERHAPLRQERSDSNT
jgi:hypothetical protein